MFNARTIVLACSTCLAACASAGIPQLSIADAPEQPTADAPQSVDGPQSRIDSPQQIDGPPAGSCTSPFTGALATWDFSGGAGTESTMPASASATGVTAGDVTRSSDLTATAGNGSINSSNWSNSSSLDTAKSYYTLTVSPPAGCALDVTKLTISTVKSGTGPADGAIGTSADSFGSTTAVSTDASSSPAVTVSDDTSDLEIRIYGYHATSTSGTMRLESTLTVTGSIH